jgi:ribonuclease BN (tRNA processing enzyme)
MTDLLLLGSAGWIPTGERETCCALLREGPEAIAIDAGTGLRRLVTDHALLDGVERLTILLTHFHLDHTAGLSFVPALRERVRCEVVGPGAAVYGTPTRAILDRLLGSPLFPSSPDRMFAAVRELEPGGLRLGDTPITWRRQDLHTDPTVAYRIGDAFAYCTDTAEDAATARFAAGTAVLLHEAVFGGDRTDSTSHAAAGEAARIARDAGVDRLVLIHRTVEAATDDELVSAARKHFPASELGVDLQRISG